MGVVGVGNGVGEGVEGADGDVAGGGVDAGVVAGFFDLAGVGLVDVGGDGEAGWGE